PQSWPPGGISPPEVPDMAKIETAWPGGACLAGWSNLLVRERTTPSWARRYSATPGQYRQWLASLYDWRLHQLPQARSGEFNRRCSTSLRRRAVQDADRYFLSAQSHARSRDGPWCDERTRFRQRAPARYFAQRRA